MDAPLHDGGQAGSSPPAASAPAVVEDAVAFSASGEPYPPPKRKQQLGLLDAWQARADGPPTPEEWDKFLYALCRGCTHNEALQFAMPTVLDLREAWGRFSFAMTRDEKLAAAYAVARKRQDVVLHAKLRDTHQKSALEGDQIPVFQGGYLTGYRLVKSSKSQDRLAHSVAPGEFIPLPKADKPSEDAARRVFGNGLRVVVED